MSTKQINSSSTKNIENYNGIDIGRFLCAILVFIVHIPILRLSLDDPASGFALEFNFVFQKFLCRVAVPFYFVSSSFFLFKKMPKDKLDIERVKNYCFKIFRLIGVWSVLLFVGDQGHLWYLGATIVAVVFLSIFLYHQVNIKWLVLIAAVLYIWGAFGDAYFGFIKPFVSEGMAGNLYNIYKFVVGESRNGFFMGFPFVLMGFIFAQGKINLKPAISLIGFFVSLVCLGCEVFILKYNDIPIDYNMYIFLLPTIFFMFAFASSVSLKNRPIYLKLRTAGVLIYFSHLIIDSFITFSIDFIYGILSINLAQFQFLISLTVTLLFAFGIERLSRKEKFTWINLLIS